MAKKVAIVVSKPPYGTAFMGEGFRAAMGLPAVGLETNVILEGDAVFALIKKADPKSSLDMESLADAFAAFEDFGFNLYVHGPSVRARGLRCEELIACQPLEDYEFKTMLRDQDTILRF
ncbi:MAG: DsrE family protein [Caldisericia bacterium]